MTDTRKNRREISVGRQEEGQPLLSLLAVRFTYQSREQWQTHINDERLLLNEAPCSGTEILKRDDKITFILLYQPLYFSDNHLYSEPPAGTFGQYRVFRYL